MNYRLPTLLYLSLLTGCGGQMMYKTSMQEFRNPNLDPAKYDVLAVLPMEPGYDAQIVGRTKAKLKEANLAYTSPVKSVGEGEIGMNDVCPKDPAPKYKGVLFVTWDRIILRDCDTHAVAFRVLGNYAGIDKMIGKLAAYLKTKS